MKFNALLLVIALVALGAMASAQDSWNRHPQCTPEPISMIGLGVAGLGLLRAKFKKAA
jgi:hypothetical protein